MDNKEIIEEIRKEKQEREAREKRYKVRKVEHYTEELKKAKMLVSMYTMLFGFVQIGNIMSAYSLIKSEEIDTFNLICLIILTSLTVLSSNCMIHSIVRKVGLEQRIKDIELELEADKQIEKKKVKTLYLGNGTNGTKH